MVYAEERKVDTVDRALNEREYLCQKLNVNIMSLHHEAE